MVAYLCHYRVDKMDQSVTLLKDTFHVVANLVKEKKNQLNLCLLIYKGMFLRQNTKNKVNQKKC